MLSLLWSNELNFKKMTGALPRNFRFQIPDSGHILQSGIWNLESGIGRMESRCHMIYFNTPPMEF